MHTCLFFGDSITDAYHLFTTSNLGNGYVNLLAQKLPSWTLINKGQDGFTSEQVLRMLLRDGIDYSCDFISLLVGVNDIPVEVFTDRPRIPDEFAYYYEKILEFLTQTTNSRLILIEPFLFDAPAQYKNWQHYIETESHIIQELAKNTTPYLFRPISNCVLQPTYRAWIPLHRMGFILHLQGIRFLRSFGLKLSLASCNHASDSSGFFRRKSFPSIFHHSFQKSQFFGDFIFQAFFLRHFF